jgi:hypothetical protein
MRSVVAGAILLLLAAPAWSQLSTSGGRPSLGFPLQDKPSEPDPLREQQDKEYKSAIEKIPAKEQKKSDDPWQGVRSSTQNQKSGR